MTFLNPLLLAGMGAISVPVLIHLMRNLRVKKVAWAAMRFLQASIAQNEKRLRIEDWVLLVLRCLLLILLSLALARPAFRFFSSGAAVGTLGTTSETAVIALDNSYSMGVTDGVVTRFEKARTAAEQVLDALPPGSSVAVYLASDIAQPLVQEPTRDLNLARKVIREATLSSRATDVQPVLKQALDILSPYAGVHKAIYLVTDGQAGAWSHMSETRQMLENAKAEVQTLVILAGDPETHNLGVSNLKLASALSAENQVLRFDAEITNYGSEEAKDVHVTLNIDAEEPSDEGTIESIPAGSRKRIALFAKFHDAGTHSVTVRIPADHLPVDDQRTVAVNVVDRIRVLLVDGKPGREPRDSEVFYLRNALTPVPPQLQPDYFIKPETISADELENAHFADYDAVIFANVPNVSKRVATELDSYIQRGGGFVLFPGDQVNVAGLNDTLAFLPAKFGKLRGDDDQTFFTFKDKDYENPIVSVWQDPGAGTLGKARFFHAYELTPNPVSSGSSVANAPVSLTGRNAVSLSGGPAVSGSSVAEASASSAPAPQSPPVVVIHYADGAPAIMERTYGLGRIVQFSSSASSAWNDLPVHPVYVPLVQRILGALIGRRAEALNIAVGAPFSYVCKQEWLGKDATIVKPDHKQLRTKVQLVNGQAVLACEETSEAGVYDVTVASEPVSHMEFAAEANPEESRLDEYKNLAKSLPAAQIIRLKAGTKLAETIKRKRSGSEIWVGLIVLALATACTESVLARQYSKPR